MAVNLEVGQTVMVPCVVTKVHKDERCTVDLQTMAHNDCGCATDLQLCASQVLKADPVADLPEPAAVGPVPTAVAKDFADAPQGNKVGAQGDSGGA